MSLQNGAQGEIHFPKRRDVFQFDDEVSAIFDSMALRSIPMYNEVHRMHVSMLQHKLTRGAVVADIGSSTGHLFRNIEAGLGGCLEDNGIKGYAVDISDSMMSRLTGEFPTVVPIVGDISDLPDLPEPADIMFCLYTIQFISPNRKVAAMQWLVRNLKVGGILVLGQKDIIASEPLRNMADEEYYKFRRDNGYTQEEIDAKTAALRGSMWPIQYEQLMTILGTHRLDCFETSRWLQFSTVVCIRRA